MKRRTLLVAFGAFAACGEPYEGEIPNTPAPDRDAGGADAPSDVASSADADADSGGADAGFDGDPCDRDRDGFRAKSEACGGDDCDDDDDRAHPDAGFVRAMPTAKTNGDWNCDGVVNREVPAVDVSCSAFSGLSTCNGAGGFKGNPPCGASGDYVTCKVVVLTGCADDVVMSRQQGCK